MYAYCLFCETQKCKYVAFSLEQHGILKAFSPQIIRRHRVKGRNVDEMYDLLPGYVFVYSDTEIKDSRVFHNINGIIRRLGSVDCGYALGDSDYDFAMSLFKKDGVVGQIKVYKIGEEVKLDDPLFNNCQGKITRIDYRKQRARVDYQFAGMDCFTWIACDLISDPSQ